MPRFAFPKTSRLRVQKDFDRLRAREARVLGNCYFGLRWMPAEKKRLGIVVSKKIDKANRRNTIKRVIRESFRLGQERFPKGDIVIIAREGLRGMNKEGIKRELERLLRRARG